MHGAPALSVIDLGWPVDLAELVPLIDELGYRRFWVTEHHGPLQSASPAVLLGMVGALSARLRIGCAGILLPLATPLRVAEDFFLLESFFPGRVDLGVAKGALRPGDPLGAALLDGRPWPDEGAFARKLDALTALMRRQRHAGLGLDPAQVGPYTDRVPQMWTCGMGRATAELAGRQGTGFAFSDYFFRNRTPAPAATDGPAAIEAYRQAFRPAGPGEPSVTVTCYGICSETEDEARSVWRSYHHGAEAMPSFIGTPDQCFEQLCAIAARYRVDELVVQSFARDLALRRSSYRLLAQRFGIAPREHAAVCAT